jgi:uncharacterized membrane protein YbhN (UPF0104 family)
MATSSPMRRGASARASAGTRDCETRRRPAPPVVATQIAHGRSPEAEASGSRSLLRRLIGLGVAAIAVSSLLLAVPALNKALTDIGRMRPGWIAAAVALEVASCASFVVVFRAFFDRVPGRLARRIAWTESGSGALLPGGGVTGYALGGVLLHDAGLDRRRIVILSGGLFWLTSFVNAVAVALGTLLLVSGAGHAPHDFLRLGLPLIAAVTAIAVVVLLALRARNARRGWQTALGEGVEQAARSARHPSWRLLGALGYLGFDIAVLWCTFRALGATPSVGGLILGYLVGYLGTLIPIPGGIGVLEGGLAGALVLYGTPATATIAAVLVYHAIAFWVPSLGGLFAYSQLRRPIPRPMAIPARPPAPLSSP